MTALAHVLTACEPTRLGRILCPNNGASGIDVGLLTGDIQLNPEAGCILDSGLISTISHGLLSFVPPCTHTTCDMPFCVSVAYRMLIGACNRPTPDLQASS